MHCVNVLGVNNSSSRNFKISNLIPLLVTHNRIYYSYEGPLTSMDPLKLENDSLDSSNVPHTEIEPEMRNHPFESFIFKWFVAVFIIIEHFLRRKHANQQKFLCNNNNTNMLCLIHWLLYCEIS